MEGWKKVCHTNGNQKRARTAIHTSDIINLNSKPVTRDKGGHYIMIRGSIQQENITIGNMYAPKSRAPKHIKQILTYLKGETDNITMIIGDFSTPLSTMDKSSRQK